MKIAVAGTGYVGLVTAVSLAHIGHDIICVDINEDKINQLKNGICPIFENELPELMKLNEARLNYTTDYKYAYSNADVIFVGVGTPENLDGSANLSYLYKVLEEIKESVERDVVVVIKSTVPIGTNDDVELFLNDNSKNIKITVVSNPEFLAQGTAVHDTLYASRIVVGVEDEYSGNIMRELYDKLTKEPYNVPLLVMDRKSAEMVKYASNDFLALKISYINEIANFCEKIGADVNCVTEGMGYDSRIGDKFLNPGIGYGGSCFPKDTKALYCLSKLFDSEIRTIKAAIDLNKKQSLLLSHKLERKFGTIEGLNIAILGLTFKPGTDDIREAASLKNINYLLKKGVKVKAYDPVGIDNFKIALNNTIKVKKYNKNVEYFTSIDEAIVDVDAVLIMTEWNDIKEYPIEKYVELMRSPIIFDGRNCYLIKNVKKYNVYYDSVGRKLIDNLYN